MDHLSGLVDKSLVQVQSWGGTRRYRLLETVRQYALERLASANGEAVMRSRHSDWYTVLAQRTAPLLQGQDQLLALEWLDAERENLRSAIAWCRDVDPRRGVRLATLSWRYWWLRGAFRESRTWLQELLACTEGTVDAETRLAGLLGAGRLALDDGDNGSAQVHGLAAASVSRQVRDDRQLGQALSIVAGASLEAGNSAKSQCALVEGLQAGHGSLNPETLCRMLIVAERLAELRGAFGVAKRHYLRSAEVARASGDRALLSDALHCAGRSQAPQRSGACCARRACSP